MDPTLQYKMVWVKRAGGKTCKTQRGKCLCWLRQGQNGVKPFAKVDEFGTWHDEWTMTGRGETKRKKGRQRATSNTANAD